ncbi:radical SAM family heme chaperone HemW [Thiomicrorhabdus sp.]|uniref:radical SAM family heme chaperone HemW n=1 Tax=Thiomicrorhabdus sp. TaxID=2039724 RepID=UPI0029C61027|nr:radical SAM family heme chaperone HemW [Thiomicrorhabdus sp.]
MNFREPLPLALYVHFPWCIEKCPYCDFNSHKARADTDEAAYLKAMIRQLEMTLPLIWGRPISSIFFGGGTPSLMSEAGLQDFMSQLRALLGFGPEIEITLEANPGTVDYRKFAGFHEAGINRLSMGVQSFDDSKLSALGRIHSSLEAMKAYEAARAAGFANINLDLMFALPQQNVQQALDDVSKAIQLEPEHLSHYQLTLEPNTPFYKQPPILPDQDEAWTMQEACQALIAEAGYQHYEVSAYAKKGRRAKHNLNYWQFGDYVGLGAGAHGKLTLPAEGRVLRTQMPASPGGYVQMIGTGQNGRLHEPDAGDLRFEFMLNALRLQDGIDLSLFELRAGLPIESIEPHLQKMRQNGWLHSDALQDGRLHLSELGKRYLNDMVELFLDD